MNIATGLAHAKIILIGEHSVVYGYPAVALPLTQIDIRVDVIHSNNAIAIIEDNFIKGPIDLNYADSMPLLKAIDLSLKYLQKPCANFIIKTQSSIPLQRGLGSSAAVSSAIIKALFKFFHQPLSQSILIDFAVQAENTAHQNSSGLDVYVSNQEHPVIFQKQQPLKLLQMNLGAYLIIADTNIYGQTKEAVIKVKNKLEYETDKTKKLLNNLGKLTNQSIKAIKQKDAKRLGRYLTEGHKNLTLLGVSCNKLNRLVNIALSHKALGAKMTGGGLGGNMLALVSTYQEAKRLALRFKMERIGNIWIQKI